VNIPSKILQNAVDQISSLPGIGKKTALRLALSLLKRSEDEISAFSGSIQNLKHEIKECSRCYNLSDKEVCSICENPHRNPKLLCIVEDIRDVMAIESTGKFKGLFHVLGGVISPMDGIGPNDLKIEQLLKRLKTESINEIILALSTTMEGDTTAFFLSKKMSSFDVNLTTIARGVSSGDELEYIDEITLGRSIVNRLPYRIEQSNSI